MVGEAAKTVRRVLLVLAMFASPSASLLPAHGEPLPQSRKGQAGNAPVMRKDSVCAAYGRGYVRAPGSSTCVKIGGGVEFETGYRRGQGSFRSR